MKIIVSGASGLVGSALVPHLEQAGHEVVRLVRSSAAAGSGAIQWDPAKNQLDPSAISGADAVVNLNGRSIADGRWNDEVKAELRSSRIDSTETIAEAISAAEMPPGVLVNASAVGFYGDRGDEVLDEASSAGGDFLAGLCRDWEAAAFAAASDQTRVAAVRLGMVVADGGALDRMLLPFKLGFGGPIGSGRQFWPWIGLDDVVGSIQFLIENDTISGPVNLVAPHETRCKEFTRTLGSVLRRPAFMPAPAFAVRAALGEMADALLLASQRVQPKALVDAGYEFRTPALEDAIRAALGKR
jgi:uncharacterized protein (TIGR01777 family)